MSAVPLKSILSPQFLPLLQVYYVSSIPGNIASVSKTIELTVFIWTGNVKELWVLTSFPLMYTYDIQISNTNQI